MFHTIFSKFLKTMNCKNCQADLPNLLLDPTAPENAAARAHVATCSPCAKQLAALESTMSLLDQWQAPAVSPYFDQKLAVRLREEQSAPAAGWFEQLKARVLFNTGRQFRPAMAGALALVLLAGGSGLGIYSMPHTQPHMVQASAPVNDLRILDSNEQALQQMDQLLQDSAAADSTDTTPQS
jgi:anti-sigma factor RsiW